MPHVILTCRVNNDSVCHDYDCPKHDLAAGDSFHTPAVVKHSNTHSKHSNIPHFAARGSPCVCVSCYSREWDSVRRKSSRSARSLTLNAPHAGEE